MIRFLTAQQVLFIHARVIATTGGSQGIRDLGLLESAVARPQATFDSKPLYPDLLKQAAALFQSLCQNHPFVDGNKRTAITSTGLFLIQNGCRIETTNEVLENFTLQVANNRATLNDIESWLEENTTCS